MITHILLSDFHLYGLKSRRMINSQYQLRNHDRRNQASIEKIETVDIRLFYAKVTFNRKILEMDPVLLRMFSHRRVVSNLLRVEINYIYI